MQGDAQGCQKNEKRGVCGTVSVQKANDRSVDAPAKQCPCGRGLVPSPAFEIDQNLPLEKLVEETALRNIIPTIPEYPVEVIDMVDQSLA